MSLVAPVGVIPDVAECAVCGKHAVHGVDEDGTLLGFSDFNAAQLSAVTNNFLVRELGVDRGFREWSRAFAAAVRGICQLGVPLADVFEKLRDVDHDPSLQEALDREGGPDAVVASLAVEVQVALDEILMCIRMGADHDLIVLRFLHDPDKRYACKNCSDIAGSSKEEGVQ